MTFYMKNTRCAGCQSCGFARDHFFEEMFDLEKEREQVRRDALLEATRQICWMCNENQTLVLAKGFVYKHAVTGELGLIDCHAHSLHQLLAADQIKQQPEPGTLEYLRWLDEQMAATMGKIGTEEE
jgi:hypothetical protein